VSNVNIRRTVEFIGSATSIYTPIIEVIVNGIQAIESSRRKEGKVAVHVLRDEQLEVDGSLPDVVGFRVEDNGVGFTEKHRDSFDTLYSDLKIKEGGKGFGRLTCLKYFEDVRVDSVFKEQGVFRRRRFAMGKQSDFIVDEKVTSTTQKESGSVVWLESIRRRGQYEKKLATLARELVERLLPYFITDDYRCPDIVLSEGDGSESIRLNAYFTNELAEVIQELSLANDTFTLKAVEGPTDFRVRVFKFLSPKNHRSKISLVAHKREVTGTPIHEYVPEFEDEFRDDADRNYIIKAYVFGDYLDSNVSLERGDFKFRKESDLLLGISQSQIELRAAEIAKPGRTRRTRRRWIGFVRLTPWD